MTVKKAIFEENNPANRGLTVLGDIFELDLLWLLCCLPVITIGASTTALYTELLRIWRREEGRVAREFFLAFRLNLKQSIPLTAGMIAVYGILLAELHILGEGGTEVNSLAYGFCLTLLLAAVAVFGYVWPLLAQFDNTTRRTLGNAWRIAVSRPGTTAWIVLWNSLPLIWLLASPETFSAVFWIWVFFGFGAAAFLCTVPLEGIFDSLMPDSGPGEEEEII